MDKKVEIVNALGIIIGSIMDASEAINEYSALTPPKRKYLYGEVRKVLKRNNKPFDEAQPMMVVDISVCAAENDVDPLTIMLANLNKGK
ncbi:hypothetical protein Dtox_1471 [Desulfofarcimen acetoxidans DSM 771]|uniref:Uncharacterized protein n=1 Tax=Desulfofarcimen acetoxidans (strain ATCC 49208 / DSM 771 / KCTC 5769 / VKM B-1644 / 5575) TaxID=485916 RepID=C8VVM0_DESAS|nr:hypothetical protein [Desulfofarcimen acetoxidans]ACV62335.1 hypothetical protein Dtox_1471 [Desulfofarcimen acetoxidans DSM 771]